MAKNEYAIQSAFVRYLELMHPDFLYTIAPAGFIMSAGMAMKMVRMGYRKGTPDLLILEPREPWHGLLIEFKDPKGTVSQAQTDFLAAAMARRYCTGVCRSVNEAIELLNAYLLPTGAQSDAS